MRTHGEYRITCNFLSLFDHPASHCVMNRELRIGLVAWYALPAILSDDPQLAAVARGRTRKHEPSFGGMETGMWTLAKNLAQIDSIQPVAFVTSSKRTWYGQRIPSSAQGVELALRIEPFRKLRHDVSDLIDVQQRRIKHWSTALLWQVPLLAVSRPFRAPDPVDSQPDPWLNRHPIDAWITFGVNSASSRVVATARRAGVPVFVSLQSNSDLDERLAGEEDFISECGEPAGPRRFVLRQSDAIICQTEWQMERVQQLFGRPSLLARNPIDIRSWQRAIGEPPPYTSGPNPTRQGVLWVGRYDDFHKRPLDLLKVARELSHIPFTMIVNSFDHEIERLVRTSCPANVTLVDQVPFNEMPRRFAASRMFVSTGTRQLEGFPNVFLQAAATHTPIVSLHDFDRFIERTGAGVACHGSLERLTREIQRLNDQPRIDWERVDHYLSEHHDARPIASRLVEHLQQYQTR